MAKRKAPRNVSVGGGKRKRVAKPASRRVSSGRVRRAAAADRRKAASRAKRDARARGDGMLGAAYATGLSLEETGRRYGVSAGRVKNALRRLGYRARNRSEAAKVRAARKAR